jgi:Tfp pilus assembly protein PilN
MTKLVVPSPPRLNLLPWRRAQYLQQWQGWHLRFWLSTIAGLGLLALPTWQILHYHQSLRQLAQQQMAAGQLLADRQSTLQQQLQQLDQHQYQKQQLIGFGLLALLDSLPVGSSLQRWSMVDGLVEVDLILLGQWSGWWHQLQQLPWWSRAELLQLNNTGAGAGQQLQVRLSLVPVNPDHRGG